MELIYLLFRNMRTKILFILPIAMAIALFTGCDSRRVFEENTTIPEAVWNKNNVIKFDVDIADTLEAHNLFLNIRNANGYQYSNIYLFVTTHSPKGASIRDTVELTLADPSGKWLGDGIGDIWDNQIPYKMNVKFPYKGIYTFELAHAMRNEKLPFIMDAGIRIEKVK